MAQGIRRRLSYEDLVLMPEDGQTHELLDGVLVLSPSPSPGHQRIVMRLARQLGDYFERTKSGEVFSAPLDVILGPHDVLEPDLLVVTDASLVTARAIEGPPALVVEVLSPSTASRDCIAKARRYAVGKVSHYWIVDGERRRMQCLRLEGTAYRFVVEKEGDTNLVHPEWPGLTIDLASLWR
jgi:Uma2 family endonuclease